MVARLTHGEQHGELLLTVIPEPENNAPSPSTIYHSMVHNECVPSPGCVLLPGFYGYILVQPHRVTVRGPRRAAGGRYGRHGS